MVGILATGYPDREANPRYPTTRRAIEWMQHKGRKTIGWGLGAPPIHGLWQVYDKGKG
jgi:hypothetical protein